MSHNIYTWLTANTFILLLVIGYLVVGLYKQQATTVSQIDHRFKSYDMFFILDHKKGDCIDTTVEEVTEYYQGRETPLSVELKVGKWLCK